MSKAQEIIESLQTGDLYTAQKLINEALMIKMGEALEEKLVEFAPSVFNEGKMAKKDYDKDGKVESSTDEWKGSRDRAIKAKMGKVQEDWTSEIPNGYALTSALNDYQNTGQMSPALAAYFQQNPPVGTGKKKKVTPSTEAGVINAGYEPFGDNIQEGEGWTEGIPDGSALAGALSDYQNTGQMSSALADFFERNSTDVINPNRSKKKRVTPSTEAGVINAGYEPDEDLNSLVESFENDIRDIVQEIQEQTGEQLSEQEIEEIAHQYLDLIGEMAEEEYEDDEEDEEDQS
jgi:hypothetical protein